MPTTNAQLPTADSQVNADQEKADEINRQSEAAQEDATPERLREDPLTGVGETQMPFATGSNLVHPPAAKGSQQADQGTPSLTGSGRKPPPIPRPNSSFILDPLLD